MSIGARNIALSRAEALIRPTAETPAAANRARSVHQLKQSGKINKGLFTKLRYAGLPTRPTLFLLLCAVLATALSVFCSVALTSDLIPIYALAGFYLPFMFLHARVEHRAAAFAADYPTVLTATASSIRSGLTALAALRRSIKLLPPSSPVRTEVERLVSNLECGMPREIALSSFAADVDQSDLDLFRAGFSLVMDNGGPFSPTLERLALVCRSRETLISSARVSTATMRMTANILVVIAPLLIGMIAARTPDYWEVFRNHPQANFLGSVGIVLISCNYFLLRRLSAFKP